MLAPRTLDDLVLSPEGEAARAAALAAIVDGIPVDLPPLPPEPPEPEPVDPVVQARRERHRLAMGRAFPAARYYGRTRGFWNSTHRGQILAPPYAVETEECVAVPDACLPVLPDPEIVDGEILWGASVTMRPWRRMDPECAFEARDRPLPPTARGEEPTDPVAVDVAAWLEGIGEPMTVEDLAELTGHEHAPVARACQEWRWAGRVAKQQTRDEPLWVWRRLPL